MKERGEIVSSASFTRAPYPPLRGPPSPMGKATKREYRFLRNTAFNQGGRQRGGGFAAFSEKILFEYVFFCAFVNDSGNFLNNNIKMIHDLKIGISNNEDSELF